jgi:hypothetical protein
MLRMMAVVAAMIAFLAGCAVAGRPEAACAGPTLRTEPARAAPGESFRLHGEWFFVGCNDMGRDQPEPPEKDIRVGFRQDDRTWRLATVDAKRGYSFDVKLAVPAEAKPGRAVVFADSTGSGTIEERFVVLKESAFETTGPDDSNRKPPESTLSFGDRTETGELGGYCWSWISGEGEGMVRCVELVARVPPKEKTLSVPAGSVLSFDYGGEAQPTSVEATALPLRGKTRSKARDVRRLRWSKAQELRAERRGDRAEIPAELPAGEYVLQIFVRVPEGDASYYFRVRMEPETGESADTGSSGGGS